MTTKQKRILTIAAVAAIVLVVIIVLVIVISNGSTTNETPQDTTTEEVTTTTDTTGPDRTTTSGDGTTPTTDTTTTSSAPVNLNEEALIVARAVSFTERYGSYSTDNDFENVEALREFMTDNMNNTANALINSASSDGEFYGITTKAANTDIIDFSEDSAGATVTVAARRTETKGISDSTSFSQTARLQLSKVDNTWKVDSFTWQ